MRRQLFRTPAVLATGGLLALLATGFAVRAPAGAAPANLTDGFKTGAWDYKAIGPLAFSPSGVLFFADDQAGAVYGVDLGEKASKASAFTAVPDLGATLAARLGTTPSGIEIKDVAISPVSKAIYLSVRKTDGGDQNPANPGNYALFAVNPKGKVTPVDLTDKPFAKVAIEANGGGRDPRLISDIAFAQGRLLVAALSGDAFKSNLVSVPVPFRANGTEKFATSIYHVSHKRQETASPIQTLTVYRDGDREYLMAAYVCTPVVRFSLDDLKPNQVVTGTTVAELGSGNKPMAMIAYGRPGQQSLLLNNSVFGVLKVDARIAKEATAVNQMTAANRGPGGKTPYAGIQPVEALKDAKGYAASDDGTLLVVKPSAGGMALETMPAP